MQFGFLFGNKLFEWSFQLAANARNFGQVGHHSRNQRLVKGQDDKDFLNVHLDHCFANECGTEKGPKRYQKMATSYASKVKQWIRYLKIK